MLGKRESFMSKSYWISRYMTEPIKFESRTQRNINQDPQGPLPCTSHTVPLTFDHLSYPTSACQLCAKPAGRKSGPLLVGTRVTASLSPPPTFLPSKTQKTDLLFPGLWVRVIQCPENSVNTQGLCSCITLLLPRRASRLLAREWCCMLPMT